MNIHDFTLQAIDGASMPLSAYAGQSILLVNTASECGFTPQYAGLQALWTEYRDRGLVVIGVPSNDFGDQEPLGDGEVAEFCSVNYGVDFPLTTKMRVIPPGEHALYAAIHDELGDIGRPAWNFHKFLFSGDGSLAGIWDSRCTPDDPDLRRAIEDCLSERLDG